MDDFMTTIGEIAEIFDGPHATPKKTTEGPYFLSISSLDKGRLDLSRSAHLSNADFEKWTRRVTPQPGDLLFSYETRLGEAALMPEGPRACLGRRMGLLRFDTDKAIPNYVLYAWLSPAFQRAIVSNTITGATVDRIALSDLSKFPIRIPPLGEQRKIAGLLSALDAKIDLNNRINAELEAMARTLYDYWFVQFDFPDENGRPHKSSGGKMVYNPVLKREIPEGWEVRMLGDIVPIGKDSIDPSRTPGKVFRYYSIPEFDKTGDHDLEYGRAIGSNKFKVSGTDLLVSKLNPWFNRVVYPTSEPDQICSTEFVVWRSSNEAEKNFLFSVATSQQFITYCVGSATGTSNSHKRVNPQVMMRFAIPYQERIARRLGEIVAPTAKLIAKNRREKKQLTNLRDWLLPMLMNGQVTVE